MFRYRIWFALLIAAFLVFPAAAVAQSHFKVLHSFDGKGEGAKYPTNIVMDASGNLYGVATHGGYSGCSNGCGAVYELSPSGSDWTYKFVYGFKGYKANDGSKPNGLAVDAAGNLYGTTEDGGGPNNAGTVFELSPNGSGGWTETMLHVFTSGGNDGYYPEAAPILDAAGNLYGTASQGGANSGCNAYCGIARELSPPAGGSGPWTETILWNFNTTDGGNPPSALTPDGKGNFFGLTSRTAYELSPSANGWTETILAPVPGGGVSLAIDAQDNLFGTEYQNADGWGEVYELARANGSWTYIDLWDFNPVTRPGDGAFPASPITVKNSVVLLGATLAGGNGWGGVNDCDEFNACGYGTIFAMTRNSSGVWAETGQFRLSGVQVGGPVAGLILDSAGNIYGTSYQGESGYGESSS
jgi:uncharacterized repeat protein (TIGR03803 family)